MDLDRRLRDYPDDPQRFLPTRLGNLLRASELRLVSRYGLDVVHCWAPFWLVLPASSRAELASARAALDGATRTLTWSALLLLLTPLTWFAAVAAALLVAATLTLGLLPRARDYADILEAAVHVHRRLLYDALRWPTPTSPATEPDAGARLTEYLYRGSDAPEPTFGPQPPA